MIAFARPDTTPSNSDDSFNALLVAVFYKKKHVLAFLVIKDPRPAVLADEAFSDPAFQNEFEGYLRKRLKTLSWT